MNSAITLITVFSVIYISLLFCNYKYAIVKSANWKTKNTIKGNLLIFYARMSLTGVVMIFYHNYIHKGPTLFIINSEFILELLVILFFGLFGHLPLYWVLKLKKSTNE